MTATECAMSLGNNIETYLLAGAVVLLVVGYIVLSARAGKKSRQQDADALAELEADNELEIEEVHVRVVSKCCGTRAYGTKLPHHETGFFVTFMTDSGETTEYRVDEETYLSAEDGMTGTVATHDGHFCGFCADEDDE